MNINPVAPKRGLCEGIDTLINAALKPPDGPTGYRSGTTATQMNRGEPPNLDLRQLVDDMWKRIAVNWVEGGCQSRGKANWRWELRPHGGESDGQPEVGLQRRIARFIEAEQKARNDKRWSNETPTGSGLSRGGKGDPGGIDLAFKDGRSVTLIELKVASNTPVSAAFQIVQYGLMLTLARLVHDQVRIITDERWKNDVCLANLRVLAPETFYNDYLGLGWFEKRLNAAVIAFGDTHDLPMTFEFRQFDSEPTTEQSLRDYLDCGRVGWT